MFDPVPFKTTFGERLRRARTQVGLPQDQLGFELGVSKSAVSAWERGRGEPSFSLLPRMQAVLKTSLDYLICGHAGPPASLIVSEAQAVYNIGTLAENPAEVELLKRYRALSKTRQSALLELIR